MDEWIRVEETLPRANEEVIGYDAFYDRIHIALFQNRKGRLVFCDSDDCDITHWMPKPKFPCVEPKGEEGVK